MNDGVSTPTLKAIRGLNVSDGLVKAKETRPFADPAGASHSAFWTHRFKHGPGPARFELFDQIWLSEHLVAKQQGAHIDRRERLGGDGSDHDAAWVVLDL